MKNKIGYIGRILRVAIGILLLAVIVPIITTAPGSLLLRAALLLIFIFLFYLGIHWLVRSLGSGINPWLGAAAANIPVLLIYFLGITKLAVVGSGAGQIAALFYIGISLLIAGIWADPGCEVMAFPNVAMEGETHLACIAFSPVDWFEDRIGS